MSIHVFLSSHQSELSIHQRICFYDSFPRKVVAKSQEVSWLQNSSWQSCVKISTRRGKVPPNQNRVKSYHPRYISVGLSQKFRVAHPRNHKTRVTLQDRDPICVRMKYNAYTQDIALILNLRQRTPVDIDNEIWQNLRFLRGLFIPSQSF